jgi:hypothetical protein
MIGELELFATRLAAEWRDDRQTDDCPAERWLARFLLPFPLPEPDTCADGLSRLPWAPAPIRWYDNDQEVLGFRDGRQCYAIPWRDIDAFLRRFNTCEDDEATVWEQAMPLAG